MNSDDDMRHPSNQIAIVWKATCCLRDNPPTRVEVSNKICYAASIVVGMNKGNKQSQLLNSEQLVNVRDLHCPKSGGQVARLVMVRVNKITVNEGSFARCSNVIKQGYGTIQHCGTLCDFME
jgi:hypothetical protein